MHDHAHYRFTVCASKWQVEFFKQQPNEVTVILHSIDTATIIGLYITLVVINFIGFIHITVESI